MSRKLKRSFHILILACGMWVFKKVFNYAKIPKKAGTLGDPHRFKGAVSKTPKYLERRSDPHKN